jgi:peptidyl-dipeptidase A
MKKVTSALILALCACGGKSGAPPTAPPEPVGESPTDDKPAPVPPAKAATPEEAKAFLDKVNADLSRAYTDYQIVDWEYNTNITDANEAASAAAYEKVLAYINQAVSDARRFRGLQLDADTQRQLWLLTLSASTAAPDDPARRKEFAEISAKMTGAYGKAKYCPKPDSCKGLNVLEETIRNSRNYDELLDAWRGWHDTADGLRPVYRRFVELANEGARNFGFKDTGELWRSGYDMKPDEFTAETERLWGQVAPLYQKLHCHVRAKLADKYGKDRVPLDGPIPAHLLGNMWAQEWDNIYPLVEPYKGQPSIDVTAGLKKKKVNELQMVKMGEAFFTSLGLDPLPPTFWERSMFVKPPAPREVVCHASAWNVNTQNDLRIKMCIKVNFEDLVTIHHELGHNYYELYYARVQPQLFKNGAHDGFHEAIGDAIALSVTPDYLKKLGLLDKVAKNQKAMINLQMKDAMQKVSFLPFGLVIDRWRWDVFAGKVDPAKYNQAWWDMRKTYQGIAPAVARGEEHFDPGAKFHIPGNTPYTRYFLARILQFQFHKALCDAAGFKGPLHECSIFGSKEAGKRLAAVLTMGQSRPWPDAMEALTGTRQMDAGPLLEYFSPLEKWLDEQNKGRQCGW